MADLKWYVVRCISGQEKKIKGYLEIEIARKKVEDYIPQILIPSEKVYEMRNGKKILREKNFFPGYMIVNADLTNAEVAALITHIPGVLGFLGEDRGTGISKKPIPIRQIEVNRIMGRVDEAELAGEKIESSYILGETITVIDGPFNGFTGSIEEVFEERKKLNVMVKIFGRSTPVELSYTQVEKME